MEFAKLPEDQWKAFGGVAANIEVIRSKAIAYVHALAHRLTEVHTFRTAGFQIAVIDGDIPLLATIKTPIGDGSISLGWRISGNELVGALEFRKHHLDERGSEIRELVWVLLIPRSDAPYSSKKERGFQMTESHFEDDVAQSYFEALVSVFASFAGVDLRLDRDA